MVGWLVGWRFHGVGGGVGGLLEHSWGGCIYSPTHEVTILKYLIL